MEVTATAVIPVWNGRDLLADLLRSMEHQAFSEILVIDNGSTDGAPEYAESRGARVIRLGANHGFAAAVNRGIAEARSEWIAILNSDVTLAPDWLQQLRPGDAWFATGKIMSARHPHLLDGTWDLISRGACSWRAGHNRPDGLQFRTRRPIGMASFTAILVRAQLFREIGVLDESFESYLEDVDFGLRCAAGNRGGVYAPEAVGSHQGSATLGSWHRETVRRMARNQVFLAARYCESLWPAILGQVLWCLVAFRHGAGWAALQGKWQGLRQARRQRPPAALAAFLTESENEIHGLQQQTGWDLYWRMYCLLLRPNDTEPVDG